jgi:hypothetical protein
MQFALKMARALARTGWLSMLMCAGCLATEPTAEEQSVTGITQPVIGGFDGTSPKLNAIGSISFLSTGATPAETTFQAQCTGALLSPNTVLTAKHCLDSFGAAGRAQNSLVFGVGPDGTAPTAYATVIAVERAPGNDGGYTGRGHDVGVLHLDKPLDNAQVMKLGAVADELLGQQFVGVGYGRADNGSELTKRRLGALTLKSRAGRTYEFLFGNFEGFYHDYTGNAVPVACVPPPATTPEMPQMPQTPQTPQDNDPCAGVKALREMYESTLLEQTHELAVGAAPGDAQPCFGDSGGPLLKAAANGELFAYGVASGGVSSDDAICDHGAIYASLDPEVTTFLQQAASWVDPCDKLPMRGACEGTRARRCSTAAEGTRRVVEVDCANAGLRCVLTGEGATATCGS